VNKYKAILLVRLEVHEVLPSGECQGQPVPLTELQEHNLKSKFTITLEGFDKDDCLRKLKEKLDEFGNS